MRDDRAAGSNGSVWILSVINPLNQNPQHPRDAEAPKFVVKLICMLSAEAVQLWNVDYYTQKINHLRL